jgi:ubiquinone/menaquinone biosynthesis C-methylase UbiE
MLLIDLISEKLKNSSSFLDIGCACGQSTAHIKQLYPRMRVVGLDICKHYLDFARKNFKDVEWKLGDIRRLPFKKNEFDVIFTHGCLIHVTHEDIKLVK